MNPNSDDSTIGMEEDFQNDPRCLCMSVPTNILIVLLDVFCLRQGSPAIKLTVSRWIGPLHYGIDEVMELELKNIQFCRHDKHAEVFELEMAFSAEKFPEAAKWLMIEGDNVSLFGYLLLPDNHIRLYTDRKFAAAVLDCQKT